MSDKLTIDLVLFAFIVSAIYRAIANHFTKGALVTQDNTDQKKQPKKPERIDIGSSFGTLVNFEVIGVFYDLDKKFAVVCPEIDDKLLEFGWILNINDNESYDIENQVVQKTAFKKGLSIFKLYRDDNPELFH